ncbi:MAG: NAD-dependent deacetylase [Bacteroidia bacterium]|nr:NAD-dependent deacetylase [Bacteroidia bacterium]
MISAKLHNEIVDFVKGNGRLTVLTGAGVSAESGIPTFRGPEGYWKVGSKNYTPQEIGTLAMFKRNPKEVWKWYLFRRTVCHEAQPNPGHMAIVEMEKLLGDRFTLITQNVDGLHHRAGNSIEKTFLIHGTLDYVRCSVPCSNKLYPFPKGIEPKQRDSDLSDEEMKVLACPNCGALTRPHILWFDEYYNEEHFRFKSSLDVASETELLITVGTSGATTLPLQVMDTALSSGSMMIDVNIEPNIFAHSAIESGRGHFLQGPSGKVLPEIVEVIKASL